MMGKYAAEHRGVPVTGITRAAERAGVANRADASRSSSRWKPPENVTKVPNVSTSSRIDSRKGSVF